MPQGDARVGRSETGSIVATGTDADCQERHWEGKQVKMFLILSI